MVLSRWLTRILEHHGVPYAAHRPSPEIAAPGQAPGPQQPAPQLTQTVLLWDHGNPVAVVIPAAARLDLGRVQAVLGRPELRLASEVEIAAWFKGCQPGAVPPLRLRAGETILMDRSLARLGRIAFTAGTPEDCVAVRFRDWWRMVRPGVGRFLEAGNGRRETQGPPTVLVVEDEPEVNFLFCRLLEKEGFACQGVERGAEALAVAAEKRPAAVLLDLMLPDMSGFDVYRQMRCPGSLRRPPVVIVTALGAEDSRQEGLGLGADAYLTKPFLPQQLVAELRAALADALT